MSKSPPKMDPLAVTGAAIPAPEPADYGDELSAEQVVALRQHAPQNEAEMGDLVHEFRW